jgi:hypothetical protein
VTVDASRIQQGQQGIQRHQSAAKKGLPSTAESEQQWHQQIRQYGHDVLAKTEASGRGWGKGTTAANKGTAELATVRATVDAQQEQQRRQQIRKYGQAVLAKAVASDRGRVKGTASTMVRATVELDELAVLPVITEDSTDSISASSMQPSGMKQSAKKTPNRQSKPSTMLETAPAVQAVATADNFRTPEKQPPATAASAKTGSSHRKRLLAELEAEAVAAAAAGQPNVRRVLPIALKSASKKPKQKDDATIELPPLLGRVPWYPPAQEEEIVLDFELIGPASAAAAAAATAESSSPEAADAL